MVYDPWLSIVRVPNLVQIGQTAQICIKDRHTDIHSYIYIDKLVFIMNISKKFIPRES